MKRIIRPGKLRGRVKAPASKSYLQRAILAATLAPGTSRLWGVGWSDDSLHALHAALSLGAEVRYVDDTLEITGSPMPRSHTIYAGESGLTSRLLSAILMIYGQEMQLTGSGSLLERPFDPILDVYGQLSVQTDSKEGKLPLTIKGPFTSSNVVVDGRLSSQYVSGLLMALPAGRFGHTLRIENPNSRPYIDMTLCLLRKFGVHWREKTENNFVLAQDSVYTATDYYIERDWSGTAFLIVAGILAGDLEITGLEPDSLQPDRTIMEVVGDWVVFNADNSLTVKKADQIPGFTFNATDCPDLFPPLVALACIAESPSRIYGVNRLTHKESNRGGVLQKEFGKLGIRIEIDQDEMIIHSGELKGGCVDAHNDHRIAMVLAVAGLRANGPVEIEGAESVSKSYPGFWRDLVRLGAHIEQG